MSRADFFVPFHRYSSFDENKMRRQVKPFVTEYRGSPRRSKDLQTASDNQLAGDNHPNPSGPRNRSFAEAEKAFHGEAVEDSYEAALRAADALFNTSSRTVEPEPGNAASGTQTPQEAPQRPSQSRVPLSRKASEVFAVDGADAVEDHVGAKEAPVSSRRILQAIEPVADRFAALESEHAPKRRGRKPGSKNKPKITLRDDWPAARPALSTVQALPSAEPEASKPTIPQTIVHDDEPVAAEIIDGGEIHLDQEILSQPRGRHDKFGWKRAGLRPGERWKRRLPRVAW